MDTFSLVNKVNIDLGKVLTFLKSPKASIKNFNEAEVFKQAKTAYAAGLIVFSYIDENDWPNLRAGLRKYAVRRAGYDVINDRSAEVYAAVGTVLLLGITILVTDQLDHVHSFQTKFATGFASVFCAMALLVLVIQLISPSAAQAVKLGTLLLLPVGIIGITLAVNGRNFEQPWQILPKNGEILVT
jgi:hypothetical protein